MKKELFNGWKWTVVSLLVALSAPLAADNLPPKVRLGTNEVSAYSDARRSEAREGSLGYVDCIFTYIPFELDIHFQPWRRVQQEVRSGSMAGFFTAMPNAVFDQYATLSDPLLLEKWYWFTPANTTVVADLDAIRTGAILGSHQQLWLEFNGVTDFLSAQDLPQLIKLLLAGRINAILADINHFERAAASLGLSDDQYQQEFFRYVPMGVYFGHQFLGDQPTFLKQFNQHIPRCVPESFSLSDKERRLIRSLVEERVEHWLEHSVLRERLKRRFHEEAISAQEIQHFDQLWRESFAKGEYAPLLELQDDVLTGFLPVWQSQLSIVTEIIIIDRQGRNLAVAPFTSDYWQGDEPKYLQGFNMPANEWYFGEVVYDQSTSRFQSQLSVPIDIDGERMGVLTLGIDIEKALTTQLSAQGESAQ